MKWSEDEIKLLKTSTNLTYNEVHEKLPHHPIKRIVSICNKLGIKRTDEAVLMSKVITLTGWTREQINQVKNDNLFKFIIDGCLLGDGCICKSKMFSQGSTSLQHIEFVKNQFKQFGFNNKINIDKKHKNKNWSQRFSFNFANRIILDPQRERWYPNGTKIIPKDVELTPITCLLWYLGDGSLEKGTSRITLATDCFVKKDLENLINKFKEINIKTRIVYAGMNKSGNPEYNIRISSVDTRNFLDYIGKCPFDDYSYKWRKFTFNKKICPECGKNFETLRNWNRCPECSETWTCEKVIDAIKNLSGNLSQSRIKNKHPALVAAANSKFKNWKNALKEAGIDFKKHAIQIRLTEEEISTRFKSFVKDGVVECFYDKDKKLYKSISLKHGSVRKFCDDSGLKYISGLQLRGEKAKKRLIEKFLYENPTLTSKDKMYKKIVYHFGSLNKFKELLATHQSNQKSNS